MKLSFVHILTLLFVAARLTGYIDWSWWLVLSPLWFVLLASFAVAFVEELTKPMKKP